MIRRSRSGALRACTEHRLLPTIGYAFATTFDLRHVGACFAGASVRQTARSVIAEYGDERVAVGYPFGAIVLINLPAQERARIVGSVIQTLAKEESHAPVEQGFHIELREGAAGTSLRFDRVVLEKLDEESLEVIALLLAQSVCIASHTEDLHEILADLKQASARMARTGRMPRLRHSLVRSVAAAIATRSQIVAAMSVLDKPAATWDSARLDSLYRKIRQQFAIEERFKALEATLVTIQQTLELCLNLTHSRRALFLEASIVALILVDLVSGFLAK
jgi:uncharacterized Rmd1/YagE family protein